MLHLPDLILDLGLILTAAAIVSILFKRLKQPVVLGYLIAGFLVSPHFSLFPTIRDSANIKIWAEIGVIFLLFGLGLEFSFKKLAQVGKSASITAAFEILFMLAVGFLVGHLLGWSRMDSLFLGGILSISSTTIIVRAFEELNLKAQGFVSLVFGALIVEDLIAILLLVLLSSVAVSQTFSGAELAFSSLKLIFFMTLWFLLGIYLIPNVLRKVKTYLSDETTLIVSIGLCLMMVVIASNAGFSPALGAFVMGSLLAETSEGKRIEHLILPVKDLFSAVFFVSVGMLIDPHILKEHFGIIVLISLVTIFGKFMSTALGAIISGKNIKTSVKAGMSLAQIGEFSFIIATLGMTLGVTSDFLYPIAVAVSAITTFTTPYLIKNSDNAYKWIDTKIPERIKDVLGRYEIAMSTPSKEKLFSLLWNEYGIKVIFNSVLIVAITLASSKLLVPMVKSQFEYTLWVRIGVSLATLIVCTPFLWAVALGAPSHSTSYQKEVLEQLERLQVGVSFVRFILGCALVGFILSHFTSLLSVSGFLILGVILSVISLSRFAEPVYQAIESKFISNLTENERAALALEKQKPELAPWSASLAEFTVSVHSQLAGKTLHDSKIKESYGVMVTMIERGQNKILAPQRETLIWPYDKLFVIGTDEQLKLVKDIIEIDSEKPIGNSENFGLASLQISDKHPFTHKPIRECGLREAVRGLIVGIERNDQRILNPDSSLELLPNDLVWIVGDLSLIKNLNEKLT